MAEILLTLFLLALILFLCYFYLAFFTGAPFVVTPMSVVHEMLKLSNIKKHTVVFDLGSGDGRILIAAAKKGAIAKGWEINPFLVAWTKLVAHVNRVAKNITVYCQTYQKANVKEADVIILYNITSHIPFLEKKLKKELKKGAKIVSYKFPMNNFKLIKKTKSDIYLYQA